MAVTLCPVAVVAGCKKCPVFSICPLKSVIGDQPSAADEAAAARTSPESKLKKGKGKR
ncbi:MAG: hypothetical protein KDJ14_10810 [Xanthomonadales bacterium]|nr:hypothetical protein [Xanthomonadales bacterium]